MFASLILKDLVIKDNFSEAKLLEKIEAISSFGINRLVIAPVYYDEESKSSIDEVKLIVDDLNLYFTEKGVFLKLYPANIIRDNYDNIKEFINGKIGSINNSRYVLLNIEESNTIKELIEIIYEFNLRNYTPIIVGPEKIKEIVDVNKNIDKLLREDCLLQLDLASINGIYGNKVLKTANVLKKKGVYSFIGFEENIKEAYINKEMQEIGKKGFSILMKKGDSKERTKTKKGLFRCK